MRILPDFGRLSFTRHEVDHIVARKHGGATNSSNLALSCGLCNKYKGTDLGSIDPQCGELQRLFNPRLDLWRDHFDVQEGFIVALTPIGRVTVSLLRLNRPDRVQERELMIQAGLLTV